MATCNYINKRGERCGAPARHVDRTACGNHKANPRGFVPCDLCGDLTRSARNLCQRCGRNDSMRAWRGKKRATKVMQDNLQPVIDEILSWDWENFVHCPSLPPLPAVPDSAPHPYDGN